jgi:hypothetical protein
VGASPAGSPGRSSAGPDPDPQPSPTVWHRNHSRFVAPFPDRPKRDPVEKPPVPPQAERFRTAVHGTVFGRRTEVVHRLHEGESLILVPDPPGTEEPTVWVHAISGDLVGHVPTDIARWLAPWMMAGGRCRASVQKVGTDDVASWRRLVIEVRCEL